MNKPTLKKITKLTNNKWANMYTYEYEYNNKPVIYYVASRHKVSVKTASHFSPDAVIVLPYFEDDEGIKVVFIKQFRYAVNNFIYDVPAGIIDKGESPKESAIREIEEEIGGTVQKLELCTKLCYTSPGCHNETTATFFAKVKLDKQQNLQDDEIIEMHIVPLDNILDFVEDKVMGVQGKMMAKIFYYQQKLKQAQKQKTL